MKIESERDIVVRDAIREAILKLRDADVALANAVSARMDERQMRDALMALSAAMRALLQLLREFP